VARLDDTAVVGNQLARRACASLLFIFRSPVLERPRDPFRRDCGREKGSPRPVGFGRGRRKGGVICQGSTNPAAWEGLGGWLGLEKQTQAVRKLHFVGGGREESIISHG
jgi:hypothetical protein